MYRYTRASRVTYGGGGGYSWLPFDDATSFVFKPVVSVTEFASLNSLLTAEAIGYVNIDKANIMTGEEKYKINVPISGGSDLSEWPRSVASHLRL